MPRVMPRESKFEVEDEMTSLTHLRSVLLIYYVNAHAYAMNICINDMRHIWRFAAGGLLWGKRKVYKSEAFLSTLQYNTKIAQIQN